MDSLPESKSVDFYGRFQSLSDTVRVTLYSFETSGMLIPLPAKSPYFRFTTSKVRQKGMKNGRGWDKNLTDLLAFEIINDVKSRSIVLHFYVGPGDEAERQSWIRYAQAKGQPFLLGTSRFQNGKRWRSLYDAVLLGKDSYDQNEDFVSEILTRNLTLFLRQKLPFLERAISEK